MSPEVILRLPRQLRILKIGIIKDDVRGSRYSAWVSGCFGELAPGMRWETTARGLGTGAHQADLPHLCELGVLDYNLRSKEGMIEIVEALASALKLKELGLNASVSVEEVTLQRLSTSLCRLTSLEVLRLADNDMGARGLHVLSTAIMAMSGLRSLTLCGNTLGGEDAKSILGPMLSGLAHLAKFDNDY